MDRLFPLTALELVLMGTFGDMASWGRAGGEARRRALRAMEQVGVEPLADRPWLTLSGGQQQRLLIARALAADAEVLALDEPTNGMDLRAEHQTMMLVRRLQQERGLTVLMVTHLLNLVANYAERLVILGSGCADVGDRDEILTGPHLEKLYHIHVRVLDLDGRRVVVPGEREGG